MTYYRGRSTQPRREPIVYRCACGERFSAEVWRAISAEDAALRTRLIEGDLNRVRCPRCDAAADVQVSVLYHDAAGGRLVYVAPTSERHRELGLRAELFALLATDAAPPTDYVLVPDVVFGAAGFSELLATSSRVTASFSPPPALRREAPAPASAPAEPTRPAASIATVPDLDVVLAAAPRPERELPRPNVAVPDPRTAVIERWIAARESDTAMFVDDRVVVCASLPASILEHFVARGEKRVRVSLRAQLHRMPSFPIVALTFVAGDEVERPDEARVVHVPLDLSRAAHRVALDQLQRRFAVEVELFDSEYLPVVSLQLALPLEEHVRYLVAEAKFAMDRLAVGTRSFERARSAFLSAGYDRLGRTPIELPSLDEIARGTPAMVRAALHAVSRWSETAAETYLLEIRGFPLPVWRRLAATVLRRAVEHGIFVPRALAERVARRNPPPGGQASRGSDGIDLPPWPELIELMIRRFAELSARLKPSDLSPADEAANWELLLREAETQGVPIEDAVRRLAEAAFERVGGQPSRRARPRPAGEQRSSAARPRGAATEEQVAHEAAARRAATQDAIRALVPLPTVEVLPLLEDRDRRLVAALALARRREVPTLPALFAAMRRMSRVEANTLLPQLAAFGTPAERWLIDGLRSKKAFMRQGCALALGRLATPLAVDALVRLVFDEPTEIWSEVARAIGDVGAPAVMPLAARMREVDGDVRERAVQALAHVAARSGDPGHAANRTAVETLAAGRDMLVANAARRALVLAPEVRNAHAAVKSERREQTLVRAFTRHFYDALDGGDDGESVEFDLLDSAHLELDESGDSDDGDDQLDDADLELIEGSQAGLPVAGRARPQAGR